MTSTLPANNSVMARCQLMILSGSNEAFRRRVLSIASFRRHDPICPAQSLPTGYLCLIWTSKKQKPTTLAGASTSAVREKSKCSAVQGHINTSFWLPEKTIKSLSASRCFIGSAPTRVLRRADVKPQLPVWYLQLNYLYACFFVNMECSCWWCVMKL